MHHSLDFTALTIQGDLTKSWSFWLCNVWSWQLISPVIDQNISLSTLLPDTQFMVPDVDW